MNNIEKIIKEIKKEFNTNSASCRYYSEDDSYFILLNDKDLFESDKFQEYIFTKKTESWNEGIFNIHFDYEEQVIALKLSNESKKRIKYKLEEWERRHG
jgi:carbohydrate-binding DOMON domain-containing protein